MVDPSQWPPLFSKVVIAIGAVLLGYVLVKLTAGFLADLFTWANAARQEPGGEPPETGESDGDSEHEELGLHVLSNFGAEYRVVDEHPTERTIRETIRNLDWVRGFHQVILITSPGVSLEVGGSLDPQDGLSSVYRDTRTDIFRVTREPPATIQNMEDLLISFFRGDGRWEQMYEYE